VLGCEGAPGLADFERAGVAWPESLGGASAKRRREFLAGRLAAASALRALGRPSGDALVIGPDRLPVWPDGVLGSISHSGALALAWVLPTGAAQGVGVDVEAVMAPERCERLGRRIAPELRPGQGAAVGYSDEVVLTLAFSAKESLFKALYPSVRRYLGFDAARLAWLAPDGASLGLVLAQDWSADWPAGRALSAHCAVDAASGCVMTLLQAPSVK